MSEELLNDLISAAAAFLVLFVSIFFLILTLVMRYRKRKKENEELRGVFAEQLLQSRLEIREQTLQHVSRELHDNIGQVASLVKINLNGIGMKASEGVQQQLNDTKDLVKQMMLDIKLLSTSLSGDRVTKAGLMASLQQECAKIEASSVFKSRFTQHGNIPPIDDEKTIILFRMVQELLNNSMKYSEAAEITVDAYYQKNNLILSVADNGNGFNVKEKLSATTDSGNGLINLQQRANAIGANLQIESDPAKGTVSTIKMPL